MSQEIKSTELFAILYKRDIAFEYSEAEDEQQAVDELVEQIQEARQAVLDGEDQLLLSRQATSSAARPSRQAATHHDQESSQGPELLRI